MSDEKDRETGILRDAPYNPFGAVIDPINGVDLSSMIRNLKMTPAERLRANTAAAINIAPLYNLARRGK